MASCRMWVVLASMLFVAHAAPQKRSVIQFSDMIRCLTNRDIYSWQDYEGYGCCCGSGGTGTPIDDTDRCCQAHSDCYDAAVQSDKCTNYTCPDYMDYEAAFIYCRHPSAAVICMPAEDYDRPCGECAAATCECDRAAAECLAASSYDALLKNWPRDQC